MNIKRVTGFSRDTETGPRSCGGGAWSSVPRNTDIVIAVGFRGSSADEDAHADASLETLLEARSRVCVGLGDNLDLTIFEANDMSAMRELQVVIERRALGTAANWMPEISQLHASRTS